MAPKSQRRISVDVQTSINRTGKTLLTLSEETGISQGKLSRLIPNPGRFNIDEFAALSKALPIDLTEAEVI